MCHLLYNTVENQYSIQKAIPRDPDGDNLKKKRFSFLPVQVPIETIIVRNEFILSLVVQLALEIHVLEHRQVGLVAG